MATFNSKNIKAVILDMDGVLWCGDEPVGDLPAVFREIDRRSWGVVLASNNATRTPSQFISKLARFGVQLEDWQAVNSAIATAAWLKKRYPEGGPVYLIGESGLKEIFAENGFFQDQNNAVAVVASLDTGLTYEMLRHGTLLIRSGALFVGTNSDLTYPTPEGLVPGSGSILAALEAATDVSPILIGKPEPELYNLALERLGTMPEETLVVGDRLETDIAGAQNIGCPTGLVMTGVSTQEDAQTWEPKLDILGEDLLDLLQKI